LTLGFWLLLTAVVGATLAAFAGADPTGSPPPQPSSAEVAEAIEAGARGGSRIETNQSAAEGVPHRDLGRDEAMDLMEGVFEPELQSAAGIFDEIHARKFLADNVAVIPAGDQPESTGSDPNGAVARYQGTTLMDSTVPLRTESSSGREEAVDLSLERNDGELRPANPLVEVDIPGELGEGVDLPEVGVEVALADAPEERTPTTTEESIAFYPNVAQDTDFSVALTPRGFETLTQVRSAEAPRSETYELTLPKGAVVDSEGGGATIQRNGKALVAIAPPTAIDSAGTAVPAELSVDGDAVTVTISPDASTTYPVLVDPLFQAFEWNAQNTQAGIDFGWHEEGWTVKYEEEHGGIFTDSDEVDSSWIKPPLVYGEKGLFASGILNLVPESQIFWAYHVPRYFSDPEYRNGNEPQSFISRFTVSDMAWQAESTNLSPYLYIGLWGPKSNFNAGLYSHEGLTGHSVSNLSYVYSFENPQASTDIQSAEVGLYSTETVATPTTYLYVGDATVEMGEPAGVVPQVAEIDEPSEWVAYQHFPLEFKASDVGLGVQSATVAPTGSSIRWTANVGCTGVPGHACPYEWKTGGVYPAGPMIEANNLVPGIDFLPLTVEDPIGRVSSTALAEVKVDHAAPEVTLSGPLAEQGKYGTRLSSYELDVSTLDGNSTLPQSGVAKVRVSVDGTREQEWVAECAENNGKNRNCSVVKSWTLDASELSAGRHLVEVTATDGVGLSTTKKIVVGLHPAPPPQLTIGGSLTEQEQIGSTLPRYDVDIEAASSGGNQTVIDGSPSPQFTTGSAGTGHGQFTRPGGIAIDAEGHAWVADQGRVEEFDAQGHFIAQIGTGGTGAGQLSEANAVTISKGNIWVADAGNNRVEEFKPNGEVIRTVGTKGAGNGQFLRPEGIAADSKGNIWVADTGNGRLEELSEAGVFMRVSGTKGSGSGQFMEPTAIAFTSSNVMFVADAGANRIDEWLEGLFPVTSFGTKGTGNGQYQTPTRIAIDKENHLWISDVGNDRIQEVSMSGVFMAQFGTPGSGERQLQLARPSGLAVDPSGNVWVADTANQRISKWSLTSAPIYRGIAATPSGQVSTGVAIDPQGNVWVASGNHLEEFTESGALIRTVGSQGTGNGQLNEATGVTADTAGNVWIADSGNNRIEEFNAEGSYVTKLLGLNHPEGVTVDTEGNVWVANTRGGSVVEYNPQGTMIKSVGSGQVGEPTALAVGSTGNVYVLDAKNDHVNVFLLGSILMQSFGTAGSGKGQFTSPSAMSLDGENHIWIADVGNNRVEELNVNGAFLNQFGTKGNGEGQFNMTRPVGLATDLDGNLWVTDGGNARVQHWRFANFRSEITVEVAVDGEPLGSSSASCPGESCSTAIPELIEAARLESGFHDLEVTAKDGLGRTTTRGLWFEIEPDVTKPVIEIGGELAAAPMGWVEQESYGFTATATDRGGSGVGWLKFAVDGETLTSKSQTCLAGACEASLSSSIDMSKYSGGAHTAEVVATDAAGNTSTKRWTINVDPDGHITIAEAEQTLEAADDTGESTAVEPTEDLLDPEEIEGGDDPGLRDEGSELVSTGIPDRTTIEEGPEGGFTIESPEESTTFVPVVEGKPSETSVAGGVAAVTANTNQEADTVIRPEYDGVQSFEAIRSAESPEAYSWKVQLHNGQRLQVANEGQAEVVHENGTLAFLITAEIAHDATGALVSTSLSVEGNILTLHVEFHKGNYVFPIVAGQNFETSYTTPVIVKGPEDETDIRQREQREREEQEARVRRETEEAGNPPVANPLDQEEVEGLVDPAFEAAVFVHPPPEAAPPGEAQVAGSRYKKIVVHPFEVCGPHCAIWWTRVYNPTYYLASNWVQWQPDTQVHCKSHVPLAYAITGLGINIEDCKIENDVRIYRGEHRHIYCYGRFEVHDVFATPDDLYSMSGYFQSAIKIYPNGYEEQVVSKYQPKVLEA
jgi:sugar lactone lactonase YvrE